MGVEHGQTRAAGAGSLEAILRVVAAFEQSDWREIDVRVGDVRVHLTAGSLARASEPSPTSPHADDSGAPSPAAVAEVAQAATVIPPDGAHLVTAPSPGIFWRSPEPGAPPFADVGDAVEAATTLCIVEVMKLMNHVKATVSGTVAAVYGSNGVAVDKGDPLFAIVPEVSEP